MGEEKQVKINLELETILMSIYGKCGVITDRDIVLKDAKEASLELFYRMRDLCIIKPPKVNFKLARAKYIPTFVGGNVWKEISDPAVRIEDIKSQIEKVVQAVFGLKRQENTGHEANEYLTGGIGTESKNKELEEKIETITNIIKHVAGTIKTLPEIKVESRDLRTMFSEGKVPPEIMDYINICFDAVIEYQENKRFDWDCFLCAIIGLAQIVAGVALEVLSGGLAHYIAQGLIAEGIGDIVFAIQSSIEGNFTWTSYGQHKVQSLMISLVTGGVGSLLSKGAQAGKIAVGLATKTAKLKAVMKTVIVESCSALITATVNVGAEKISELLIEEIANTHFGQYLEKWTKEDSAYYQKTMSIEDKLNALYNKFGTTIAKSNIETCIESSFQQLISGDLGYKIFDQIHHLVGGIIGGFSKAASRLGNGNSKGKVLGSIVNWVGKTLEVAQYSKDFAQLCNISNDFYEHLIIELSRMEVSLIEQQKNGTLKIDETQITQEKVQCALSGEVSKDIKMIQERLHVAFKAKIKKAFLQPAVSSLLSMAMKPIQQIITAPFNNAMKQLEDHIDSRAEIFQQAIMNQHKGRVVPITAAQKKGLELRGEIIKVEDIKNPALLQAGVANFAGETLANLQREHGTNLNVMIRDGKIYAVLPTYKQLCDNIKNGILTLAGALHIKMAATQAGRKIEVVSVDVDGSKTLMHYEKGPGIVEPIRGSKFEKESHKIAFMEGAKDKPGHYAPVIKDRDGNWMVIRDIGQTKKTKDACFAQTMVFLKEYEKNGSLEGAKLHAENFAEVSKYNASLGKSAKYHKEIKDHYLHGATVKNNRIVGGTDLSRLEKTLGIDKQLKDQEKGEKLLWRKTIANKLQREDSENVEKQKYLNAVLDYEDKFCPSKNNGKKDDGLKFEKNLKSMEKELQYESKSIAVTLKVGKRINNNIRKIIIAKELLLTHHDNYLARQYNDNIHPNTYSVQFSQDSINAQFNGHAFKGQSVVEVGKRTPFPAQDFQIKAFFCLNLPGELVIDNNRGLAAHAIAGIPVAGLEYTFQPNNMKAFNNRKSKNGNTVHFDKNYKPDRKPTEVSLGEAVREYGRTPSDLPPSTLPY